MFRNNLTKKNKKAGLMLYEMILSVFIISICSGFILQFFLYSNEITEKANDIDNSGVVLHNAIELSKAYPTVSKYLKDDFFDGSIVTNNDLTQSSKVFKFYDEQWNPVCNTVNSNKLDDDIKYVLELNVTKLESTPKKAVLTFKQDAVYATTYGNSSGLKYEIKGEVYYANNSENILLALETTSYFGNNIK